MSTQNLENKYLSLVSVLGVHTQSITLQEVADILYCSKRHARNIVLQMQEQGWICWESSAGRSKRSQLRLLMDHDEFNEECLKRLVDKGQIQEAISLVKDDEIKLQSFFSRRFGHSVEKDRHILRVPYYRTLPNLYPGTALRRSEVHLIHQIFNGLTRYNEEKEEVEGDISFYWKQKDSLTWQFYLRQSVYFHNGKLLDSTDVVNSLLRCIRRQPAFSNIKSVKAVDDRSIIIQLYKPSFNLPLLLTDPSAMILPKNHQAMKDFYKYPVGTGAYKVAVNDHNRLHLIAYERYFGYRALLDEIEIITLPAKREDKPNIVMDYFELTANTEQRAWVDNDVRSPRDEQLVENVVEQGAYFILFDHRNSSFKDQSLRAWFEQQLQPCNLLLGLPIEERKYWMIAQSFLPKYWHTVVCNEITPPSEQYFKLGYPKNNHEHYQFAITIKDILAVKGVVIELVALDYDEWESGTIDIDIWLGSVMFSEPKAWNCIKWLLNTPVIRASIMGNDIEKLKALEDSWHSSSDQSADFIAQVLKEMWIRPLFHHWLRLRCSPSAQGVKLNNLGWFDFKSIWLG